MIKLLLEIRLKDRQEAIIKETNNVKKCAKITKNKSYMKKRSKERSSPDLYIRQNLESDPYLKQNSDPVPRFNLEEDFNPHSMIPHLEQLQELEESECTRSK